MLLDVLRIINLACLLTVRSTELFRQNSYTQIAGVQFSHAYRCIRSLAARKLGCAVTCLRTAACDSFHYNNNTSSVSSLNCELLMTSVTDYAALTPAADWSVYSSHPLLTTGEEGQCMIFSSMSTHEH